METVDPLSNPEKFLQNIKKHRAIGFLRRGEPFASGNVDPQVFERLCELTQEPKQPWACGGVHFCDLCRFTGNSVGHLQRVFGKPGEFRNPGYRVSAVSSSVDLWIPGNGFLYHCPTSITHYIDCHGFSPPDDFCDAVLKCPPTRSIAYYKLILANGGRELGFGMLKSDISAD